MSQARALGGWKLLALYLVAIAAALSPLAWASVPPLVDYPNHLARTWILANAGRIPDLAANYIPAWRVLPDLAMDAVVVALAQVMPVEWAGRLFIALTMAALIGGTATLHRAVFGRFAAWPLAGLLCLYSSVLFWGFLSCLFSMGMALFAFAGWIASRHWPALPRLALFAGASLLLMLGHLFAFGLYGLLVIGYEAGLWLAAPRRSAASFALAAVPGVQFVPAVVLWYATLPPSVSTYSGYGNILNKLADALAPFLFGYLPTPLDLATWVFGVALLGVGLSRRGLAVAPTMRVPLILAAIATVAMPTWLGGGWAVDRRLPVMLPLLVMAASTPSGMSFKLRRALMLAGTALFALRLWQVTVEFATEDRWYSEFRAATAVMPPGARLMMVAPKLDSPSPPLPGLPRALGATNLAMFRHMGALAVIDRSAFYPYLFARWNPVRVADRNLDIWQGEGLPATPDELRRASDPAQAAEVAQEASIIGEHYYWRNWTATFDYVAWISFDPAHEIVPPQLEPVARGSFFILYRVKK